jgi:hypothetical protein
VTNHVCACGEPTSGAWLCDKCTKTFRWALVNVAVHYTDLGTVERKQTRYGTSGATKGSIGKQQPLPVDMRFLSPHDEDVQQRPSASIGSQLKYDTWATVVAWTRVVMAAQPPTLGPTCDLACLHITCAAVRRNRWPRRTVTSMVGYLARQFRHILAQQWAPTMMDEFLDLERRLAYTVNRPPDRWYAGRCGYIDERGTCETELYAQAEKGHIDCPGCGIRHDVPERRAILLNEAKDYQVTATEAAAALLAWTDYDGTEKKLVDRIAKWRDRGRLDVADVTSLHGRDRHLYRLGDVQDLLVNDAQDAQEKSLAVS